MKKHEQDEPEKSPNLNDGNENDWLIVNGTMRRKDTAVFSRCIRKLREITMEEPWTQAMLSERSGVSIEVIDTIEAGRWNVETLTVDVLYRLSTALEIVMSDLFDAITVDDITLDLVFLSSREKNCNFGEYFKENREKVDLSYDELAKTLNVTPEVIQQIEVGTYSLRELTAEKVIKLGEALQVPLRELADRISDHLDCE
jgi:transcriptional regulator with XRE-family HTH domain